MAFKIDRINGQNYADNIIDPLLLFDSGTYTVASGTGSASINTNTYYVGSGSLRIQNNTPASDIVITNSSQSTIIDIVNDYQLSFYVRKDFAEAREGAILIYQNAVLLDTQTFSIDAGITNEWVRFQSDTKYSIIKTDNITFQFRLDGVATAELTTSVFIDGLMLNSASRFNGIVPSYTKPVNLPVVLDDGWQSRFQATTQSLTGATNNLITIVGSDESNGGLTLLDVNGKVTPVKLGDYIGVDFACTIVTPAGADNYITVDFFADSVVYRSYTHSLLKGSGNDDTFSITANLPVGSDLFTNGLEIYITPNTGIDIKDKYIAVGRLIIGK